MTINRRVTFDKLWIVSERDRAARIQPFNSPLTLFLGGNGTGKSRVVKHLFWAFGCEPPKRATGSWDPDVIVGLDFSFADEKYLVVRRNKRVALFGHAGLIFAAGNMGAWADFIGPFFGYGVELQRPKLGRFSQAGMEYLTLPFYMDQDGSWGMDWDAYTNLGQFTNWKRHTFEAFIGLKPNAYFKAKQARDEIHGSLVEKQKEHEAQRVAFDRVREILPRNLPSLDTSSFRAELAELCRKELKVQQKQVALRARLTAAVNLRETLTSELQLALAANEEVSEDLTYLSNAPGTSIECPTCGTVHAKSFHARLKLSQDAESMAALVSEMRKKLEASAAEEGKIRNDVVAMDKSLTEVDALMHQQKARLRLDDVLASHSKKTLDVAFRRVAQDLGTAIRKLEQAEDVQTTRLKGYEDRKRQQEVLDYYQSQVTSLSAALNVPSEEQVGKSRPSARAESGGSSAPRSMLAIHLALLRTNVEFGDTPLFPFVVDTPQQSGQDPKNLKSMIEILQRTAGREHQVILAVETVPQAVDTANFEVIEFEQQHAALSSAQFNAAADYLRDPYNEMNSTLDAVAPTKAVEAAAI